ncbi:MAG: exodeoxyribonuclease VII large subunit [Eubacterium sp.]
MKPLTVTQVNTYIKALLDEIPHIKNIYICGEISNFKHYYNSGHMYFTLKDEKSQLKAVMFSSDNYSLKFQPENGMKVICFGQIGVYERDGVYQLYCRDMQPQGVGSLTIAFEQLKEKLEAEGLFREDNKKPIPKYPKKIGVVTSKMGAAVEDIKNVISRRYPLCDIIIVPTVVQGDAASGDIVKSIKFLDSMGDIDTIIVGRGGGSLEDLWAFNTEAVARAVYECNTPIISAVGHETDYTICDFVSDLRAPTPSAAAELAVPDIIELRLKLNNLYGGIEQAMDYRLLSLESKLKALEQSACLNSKAGFYDNAIKTFNDYLDKLNSSFQNVLNRKQSDLSVVAGRLDALSPLNVLARGYSIVTKNNKVVKSTDDICVNDDLKITFKNGNANVKVFEVNSNE